MKYPSKYTYLDGGSFQKLIRKKREKLKWLMKCKLMLYACPLDSVHVVLMAIKWITLVYRSVFIEDQQRSLIVQNIEALAKLFACT